MSKTGTSNEGHRKLILTHQMTKRNGCVRPALKSRDLSIQEFVGSTVEAVYAARRDPAVHPPQRTNYRSDLTFEVSRLKGLGS